MIKTKKRMTLCILLLCAVLGFIWGNSMIVGAESAAVSGRVMSLIKAILRLSEETAEAMHPIIRKIAHFTEFACLGMLLTWLHGMMGEKKGHLVIMPLLWSLAVACVDETIQRFVPQRHGCLTDVGIDTAGVLTGIVLFMIVFIINKKQHLEEMK